MLSLVNYKIRNAKNEDAEYLALNLRAIDRKEIDAVSGRDAKSVIESGFKQSDYCKVGTVNNFPVCIYGVRKLSLLSNTGVIWLLGTDDLQKHTIRFIRECRVEVHKMLEELKIIENWCHADNKKTLRWLKWLGFTIDKAKPYGRKQELFHHFYMESM